MCWGLVLALVLQLACWVVASGRVDLDRVVFVVRSQSDPRHAAVAAETKSLLSASGAARVHLTHEDARSVRHHGAWTYFPAIETVAAEEGDFDWLVFLEEDAGVNVGVLAEVLSGHRPDALAHFGHALEDRISVVIHHYDAPHIRYAHPDAGLVLSAALVKLIRDSLGELRSDHTRFPKDFSIDPQYELAKAINHLRDRSDPEVQPPELVQDEIPLTHDDRFCLKQGPNCAVYPRNVTCGAPSDVEVVALAKKTLFAVKTCKKFHAERLSVIQDTWVDAAHNVEFFSEEEDPKYGTTVLPGVVNTARGHCGKTEAILRHFASRADGDGLEWLVIADDDTILGVRKTVEQLWCYGGSRNADTESERGVHLGQRYGFRVASGKYGYDYITGGGSMIFDKAMAARITSAGRERGCACPRADSPDDMHLGACLANLGLSVVHSPRFHQGRPEDYHPKMLEGGLRGGPASFHKSWNTNPRITYDKYFRESDAVLRNDKTKLKHLHEEL